LRAEAREAERIKEEDERKKMEQERAALRARRLMEREGLLRRFRACYVMSHERMLTLLQRSPAFNQI
jgi:hypothetical protein